jgi:uncharacterized membrane protein
MSDAIEQRVEQFVQEILDLLQQARGVSCAAALKVVSTMLTGVGQPPEAKPSAERHPPTSRGARTPTKAATSPRSGAGSTTPRKAVSSSKSDHRRRRGTRSAASQAVVPAAVPPLRPASVSNETEGPVTQRLPTSASPVTTSSAPAAPVPEREALVLDAVRALGKATASEVAERTGQPNGSVAVALRMLVARGLVARTKTERGVEYNVASNAGTVAPC